MEGYNKEEKEENKEREEENRQEKGRKRRKKKIRRLGSSKVEGMKGRMKRRTGG